MSVITDLSEGAAKGLFSGIGTLFKDIRNALGVLDPDKRAELEMKLAELEMKSQELQAQSDKTTQEDRASARLRESAIAQAGGKDIFPKVLDVLAIGAFVGVLFLLFYKLVPDGATKDVLLIMLGALTAIVKDVYGYYRGSSAGSSAKSNAITDALTTLVSKK